MTEPTMTPEERAEIIRKWMCEQPPNLSKVVSFNWFVEEQIREAERAAAKDGFQAGLACSWLDHDEAHKEMGIPIGPQPGRCNSCKSVEGIQNAATDREREGLNEIVDEMHTVLHADQNWSLAYKDATARWLWNLEAIRARKEGGRND